MMRIIIGSAVAIAAALLFCPADCGAQTLVSGTYKGTLHTGRTGSYLVSVGEESGDFAAFCFTNASKVGRAILAKCKDGDTCQVSGRTDQSAGCKVDKATEAVLSGRGRIVSVRSVRLIHRAAPTRTVSATPEVVIKNLYAAQKAGRGPFFQTRSRSLLDRTFTKDFADLIWKDRIMAGNEVGYLDFDPLYNAQDVRISGFKIGKAMYGEGNLEVADVPVNFKNMGQDVTVLFRLEEVKKGVWKISDIHYPDPGSPISSLKGHLGEFLNKPQPN